MNAMAASIWTFVAEEIRVTLATKEIEAVLARVNRLAELSAAELANLNDFAIVTMRYEA